MKDFQVDLIAEPSKAEMAAVDLMGNASGWTKGSLVPLSARIPVWVMGPIDALATRSGRSRNYVINLVIEAGLEAIKQHLPTETQEAMRVVSADLIAQSECGEVA